MPQNIYDDPVFFDGYRKLDRSVDGLDGAPEWPSLRALLPDMRGLQVVDLGCGFGWFCRFARERGAERVLGLDISENMLARAHAMTADPAISYRRADLESLDLPEDLFDLAFSSLALHYVADLEGLLANLRRALRPGGTFVLSMEHPIFTAPTKPGWIDGPDGNRVWPLDRYLVEGPRRVEWLGAAIEKHHRTMGTILNLLLAGGFTITHVEDWRLTAAQVLQWPNLADELHRPMFLLVRARRGSADPE